MRVLWLLPVLLAGCFFDGCGPHYNAEWTDPALWDASEGLGVVATPTDGVAFDAPYGAGRAMALTGDAHGRERDNHVGLRLDSGELYITTGMQPTEESIRAQVDAVMWWMDLPDGTAKALLDGLEVVGYSYANGTMEPFMQSAATHIDVDIAAFHAAFDPSAADWQLGSVGRISAHFGELELSVSLPVRAFPVDGVNGTHELRVDAAGQTSVDFDLPERDHSDDELRAELEPGFAAHGLPMPADWMTGAAIC